MNPPQPPSLRLEFPARPIPRKHDLQQECSRKGLPTHAWRLLAAQKQGIYYEAKELWDIDRMDPRMSNPRFFDEHTVVQRIMAVVSTMSYETRRAIYNNQFHTFLYPNPNPRLRLPFQHPNIPLISADGQEERPMIYTLGLCGENGEMPTISEMSNTLERMLRYAHVYPPGDKSWIAVNKEAVMIDKLQPYGGGSERTWRPSAKMMEKYLQDENGALLPNPRRFARNESNRRQILSFVAAQKARIALLQHMSPGDDLPYCISDVGWSMKPTQRQKDHYSHSKHDHVVKNLLETCVQLEAVNRKIFMRLLWISPVLNPESAGIAEHALSLMWGAYSCWGGAVTSPAGVGVETHARNRCTDIGWMNAASGVVNQGVLVSNLENVEARLEMDEFLEKYRQPKSETKDLLKAEKRLKNSKEDREAMKERVVEKYVDFAISKSDELEHAMKLVEIRDTWKKLRVMSKMVKRGIIVSSGLKAVDEKMVIDID